MRLGDAVNQEKRFDGHRHVTSMHLLLCCGAMFGNFIRFDITLDGSVHDRKLFNISAPVCTPAECFSGDETVIGQSPAIPAFKAAGRLKYLSKRDKAAGANTRPFTTRTSASRES